MVEKGDILLDLDPVDAKTQLTKAKRFALTIKVTRLQAEVDGVVPDFSEKLITTSPVLCQQSWPI